MTSQVTDVRGSCDGRWTWSAEVVTNEALGYDMKGMCKGILFSWNVLEEEDRDGESRPLLWQLGTVMMHAIFQS